jgi:hypothetical protein
MAGFQTKTFLKHDDYMTPKSAWEAIKHLIPKDKVIWEAFYGDGKSGNYLREMGFNVIHEPVDFFENNLGEIIISNPPFSKTKEVIARLKELGKPFIIIMPSAKIHTSYFREFCKDNPKPLQIIIPRRRIHFKKFVEGKPVENWVDACNFDCFYYCWKIDLPTDIFYLD